MKTGLVIFVMFAALGVVGKMDYEDAVLAAKGQCKNDPRGCETQIAQVKP